MTWTNERHADIICILEELHKYVPGIMTTTQVRVVQDNDAEEKSTVHEDVVHRLLLGGDQLTAARIRGTHAEKTFKFWENFTLT